MKTHIDIESRSELDLRKVGVYAYAAHPSTEIISMAYDVDGDMGAWRPGDPPPVFSSTAAFYAYNAEFEITMLNGAPGERIGFQKTNNEQWEDVMAYAAYSGLPRKLELAAKAVGSFKDLAGSKVMKQLARPRSRKARGMKESRLA